MDDKALDNAVKEGWITKKQREKIVSRAYLTWLARTNKAKNHKPKPSLSEDAWAQKLASASKAKEKSSQTKKKKTTRKKRKSSVKK